MKNLIDKHVKYATMVNAQEFVISASGKDIVIKSDSVVGEKIKSFIANKKDNALQELKDKVNAL